MKIKYFFLSNFLICYLFWNFITGQIGHLGVPDWARRPQVDHCTTAKDKTVLVSLLSPLTDLWNFILTPLPTSKKKSWTPRGRRCPVYRWLCRWPSSTRDPNPWPQKWRRKTHAAWFPPPPGIGLEPGRAEKWKWVKFVFKHVHHISQRQRHIKKKDRWYNSLNTWWKGAHLFVLGTNTASVKVCAH